MTINPVEDGYPRNKEWAQLVIEWIDVLSIECPNWSQRDKHRRAVELVEMQTTEQLDLPSRDAKPGSGNHNNKHNFHGEDGKFIPLHFHQYGGNRNRENQRKAINDWFRDIDFWKQLEDSSND